MKKKIALVGVGGHFFDIFEELENRKYEIIGYINDKKVNSIALPYLGDDNISLPRDVLKIITVSGVGKKIKLRKRLYEIHKDRCLNLFFKGSMVSKYITYKKNSGIIIHKNTLIKANCVLGKNVFINSGCIVGHNVSIGDHTKLSLGVLVGGNVSIGRSCFLGMGTKVFQDVKIGNDCTIGANSLITKSIPDGCFVVKESQILRTSQLKNMRGYKQR